MSKGKPSNWRDKEFTRLKKLREQDWYWWVDEKPKRRRKRKRVN